MNSILERINSAGCAFGDFALPMLVQSGVLILILLLADLLLRKRVRAVFRYWIWMLVLVKLVLPPSLSSPLSLGYWIGDELAYVGLTQSAEELEAKGLRTALEAVPPIAGLEHIETSGHTSTVAPTTAITETVTAEPAKPPPVAATKLSWQAVVLLVWLAVVVAMGLLLLQRAVFVRGLAAQAREANRLMADSLAHCCERMGMKMKVGLKVSVNAASPAVCGLLRPVILVPENLASSLSSGQLQTVLLHELAHIKRGDLWVNLAQTILQIVYFYNPLLWFANAIIRRIREQAVDEMVLVAMGEAAQQYPQTLVNVAKLAFRRPALSLRLIGVVESKNALAGRIKHILSRPVPKTAKLGILGLLVVIIIAAILLPMATCRPGPPGLVIKGTVRDAQTGEPIEGVSVFDDGYAHKPNWEQIKADERSEWGAITNSAGEYSFLTWPEHHSIKVEATGYKSERQSLYNGHFVFNKKDEEIFDFALEPEKASDSSEFKTKLLTGVTVELIGICEHPSEGKQWWRPDGTALENSRYPYQKLGKKVRTSIKKDKILELALRFSNLLDKKIGITCDPADSGFGSYEKDIWATTIQVPREQDKLDIKFGIAAGLWTTAERSTGGGVQASSGSAGAFAFAKPYESNGSVGITVTHDRDSRKLNYRIVAVDNDGVTHTSSSSTSSGISTLTQTTVHFTNLTLEQIKEFRFQTRPYQWVEFRNVSLRPGVITDMRIEVEKSDVLRVPSDKYPTIQSAVNVAKDGDTIVVKSDVYEQNKVQIILQANVFTVNTPLSSITDFLKNEFDINKTTTELTDAQAKQFKEWVTSIPGTNIATSPRTIVFDGQSTEMSITTLTEYILYEKDADSPSGYKPKREEINTGVEIEFRPELRRDNKLINLALNITKSDIPQIKEITHESGNEVQLPAISRREISTMVAIPIGKYCLIPIAGIRNMLQSEINIQTDTTGKQTILLIKADVQVPEIGGDRSGGRLDSDELSGRVVDENGNTVADAQVALSTEKIGVVVSHGRLEPIRSDVESRIVPTDSRGMFDFGQRPAESFDLIVAHDKGFALVGSETFVGSREIQLQPWGRIEGQLARGRNASGHKIWMAGLPNSAWLLHRRDYRYEIECDADGRFAFERVPAGWFEVGYLIRTGDNSWSITSRTPVEVKAGEAARMTLGGSGRPVIGRLVPPEGYDKSIYFGSGLRALQTTRPDQPRPENYERMTRRQQQQWRTQWRKTDEYRQYRDAYWHDPNWRQYTFRINNDGLFRIEDVIAGKYDLTVWIEERLTGGGRPEEIASYYGTIEVAQMPGGRSDEPLDLGELELAIHEPLRVGDAAPLFEAKTLDGGDLRLIDYRGKFVLLSFWQPVSHPEIERLRELYDAYHPDGRLEIIGLGGHDILEEVRKYVEENDIPWPQIFTGEEFKAGIAKDYRIPGIPWIFLVDPDGKIVATGLRGEELKSTVQDALESVYENKTDAQFGIEGR